MALFKPGPDLESVRGRVGPMVARSYRRSGVLYQPTAVQRRVPPASNAQRGRMVELSRRWNELSEAQRDAWNAYANEGETFEGEDFQRRGSGRSYFIRANTWALQAGEPLIEDGPPPNGPDEVRQFAFIRADVPTQSIVLRLVDFPEVILFRPMVLAVSVTKPQPFTRRGFRDTFRTAGVLWRPYAGPLGDFDPVSLASPYTLAAGQRLHVRVECGNILGEIGRGYIFPLQTPPEGQAAYAYPMNTQFFGAGAAWEVTPDRRLRLFRPTDSGGGLQAEFILGPGEVETLGELRQAWENEFLWELLDRDSSLDSLSTDTIPVQRSGRASDQSNAEPLLVDVT